MEMNNPTITLALNGVIERDAQWIDFMTVAKEIFALFGHEITHLGIESKKFHTGKTQLFEKNERKIIDAINNHDVVESMSFYQLPSDYDIALFDYNLFLARDCDTIILTVNEDIYHEEYTDVLIEKLSRFIMADHIEKFEMDRNECPMIFAGKLNPPSHYKTLKNIEVYK